MGFFSKLKNILGFAAQAQEDAELAMDVAKGDVPAVLEHLLNPGSRAAQDGDFVLFRDGEPVRDYLGMVVRCACAAGRRLPPGFVPGDVWRQVSAQ